MEIISQILSLTLTFSIIYAICTWPFSHGENKEKLRDKRNLSIELMCASFLSLLILQFFEQEQLSGYAAILTLTPFMICIYRYCSKRYKAYRAEKETHSAQKRTNDINLIVQMEMLRLIMRHVKTIVTKYEQALYRDDYGEIKIGDAEKEINYFIENVIKKKLLSMELPAHICREEYDSFLSFRLNNTEFMAEPAREHIEPFLTIIDMDGWGEAIYNISCTQAAYLHICQNSSEETVQFLFGQNYHPYLNAIVRALDDKAPLPEDALHFFMSYLISPEELTRLQEWFAKHGEFFSDLSDVTTGQEFEIFCQNQLLALGWNVKTTRATGDFGADLVAERDSETVIIQCKHYSQPIGVKAVQEAFSAMKFYNAHRAAVVSNQTFTKAARQMAEKNSVALLHVSELEMLA